MNNKKAVYIPTGNFKISADFFKTTEEKSPLIIFTHGFKGFKDWGGFPYMMEKLSGNGFAAVSFNFTHNGVSISAPAEFTKPELFAENTYSKELEELGIVIDFFYTNGEMYGIDKEKISLIGHSRGGGISIIKASADHRIKSLITYSSVSDFDRWGKELKLKWVRDGFLEIENQRTRQMMRLNISLLRDFENNSEKLNIINSAANLKIPFLIIHGKEDAAVKSEEAERIFNASDKKLTKLHLVENTGHTFGTAHPFLGTTDAFEQVINLTVSFLKKNFSD